jgi:hypothetical protein
MEDKVSEQTRHKRSFIWPSRQQSNHHVEHTTTLTIVHDDGKRIAILPFLFFCGQCNNGSSNSYMKGEQSFLKSRAMESFTNQSTVHTMTA